MRRRGLKYLLSFAVALLGTWGLLSAFSRGGAPLLVMPSTAIDLGVVNASSSAETRDVEFWNNGTKALSLELLGSSCGCITVTGMTTPVPPREKGFVRVHVDPRYAGNGEKTQRLAFATNDPQRSRIAIVVKWRTASSSDVRISPREILVDLSDRGVELPKVLIFDAWNQLEIPELESSDNIRVSIREIRQTCRVCPSGVGRHFFLMELSFADKPAGGKVDEWVRFETNHPMYPVVTIPIRGIGDNGIALTPAAVSINSTAPGVNWTRRVRLGSSGEVAIKIRDIKCEVPWLSARVVHQGAYDAEIELKVNPTLLDEVGASPPLAEGAVLLRFSEPAELERRLAVSVFR